MLQGVFAGGDAGQAWNGRGGRTVNKLNQMVVFALALSVLAVTSAQAQWGTRTWRDVQGTRGWSYRYNNQTCNNGFFTMDVPPGTSRLTIRTGQDGRGGQGDCDLFVQYGRPPTTTQYAARHTGRGYRKTITLRNPGAGRWYIRIRARTRYQASLQAEVAPVERTYMVIDLAKGPRAGSYPVRFIGSAPPGGWTDEFKTTKLVLRRIPSGSYIMGSPTNELGHEMREPQHEVILRKRFYIGVFEVTQKQWERVMGDWPSRFRNVNFRDTRPLENVSYQMIRENPANLAIRPNWPQAGRVHPGSFMGRLQARTRLAFDLPTEAQWEYACRAGTTTALNSGKNLTHRRNCPNAAEVGRNMYNHPGGMPTNSFGGPESGTAVVGSYLPNSWGLYDMHGNVWEWCRDWYVSGPPGSVDPPGPPSGIERLLRGGSWNRDASMVRSANRNSHNAWQRISTYGFRVYMSPGPLPGR
jgi:formylglycine-generating enzyme required for sulfatase activity